MLIFFLYNNNMKYILFDFNGTIVDDVELSLEAINHTAKQYLNRDTIYLKEYKDVFTFPVKKYYERLGFDFGKLDWEEVGSCWFNYYQTNRTKAKLHDGIVDLLMSNHLKGYQNIVLSASKKDLLINQLKELEVFDYFDEVLGIEDIYATSKLPIGLKFISDKNPDDCILIGDSEHDKFVGDSMGVETILVANGHEAKERLLKISDRVYDSIKEVML